MVDFSPHVTLNTLSCKGKMSLLRGNGASSTDYMWRMQWKGYASDEDTWEPTRNAVGVDNCYQDQLMEFKRGLVGKGKWPPTKTMADVGAE